MQQNALIMSLNLLPLHSISEVAVQYNICIHTSTAIFQSDCMHLYVNSNAHRSSLYTQLTLQS